MNPKDPEEEQVVISVDIGATGNMVISAHCEVFVFSVVSICFFCVFWGG